MARKVTRSLPKAKSSLRSNLTPPTSLTKYCEKSPKAMDFEPVAWAGMNGSATSGFPSSRSGLPRTAEGSQIGRPTVSVILRNPPIVLSAASQ
jgi:hypothetical protein